MACTKQQHMQQQHLCLLKIIDFGLEQADLLGSAAPVTACLHQLAEGGFISYLLHQRPGHLVPFCLEQICLQTCRNRVCAATAG